MIPRIADVYIGAFKGEPWYEVSMCEDESSPKGCESGFSPLEVGQVCSHCNKTLTAAAYNQEDLKEHFRGVMDKRDTAWYVEEVEKGNKPMLALAAFAWAVDTSTLVAEKYKDNKDAMKAFLERVLPGEGKFVYLDEIFADRTIRPTGNLRNFKQAILGLADKLGNKKVMFRTINERLIRATQDNFSGGTKVYRAPEVPDRRAVVVVDLSKVNS